MAAYLQCLKETFIDPTEALRIEWIDIDASNQIVKINHPVKGHNPRQLKVSYKLLAMLNSLPKKSERVFPMTYGTLFSCYSRVRKRAAEL
jgi:integrase